MSKSNKSENPAIYQGHSIDPQLCRYAYSNPCNFDYTVTYKTIQIKNKTDRQTDTEREREKIYIYIYNKRICKSQCQNRRAAAGK